MSDKTVLKTINTKEQVFAQRHAMEHLARLLCSQMRFNCRFVDQIPTDCDYGGQTTNQ